MDIAVQRCSGEVKQTQVFGFRNFVFKANDICIMSLIQ